MQIRDSDFFSQLVCWAGSGSATPTLEELGDLFADPDFDEQRDVMNPVGDEPIDVSALPTLELPETVLFPDEVATFTVSRTDPLLRLVEQGRAVVRLGDAPPATLVKFRAGSGRPREDDAVRGKVCTLGTVSVTARYGPGEASLGVLTCARVVSDGDKDEPPGRNPAYPVFGACADFSALRENFVKLIRQSPGIDAVPGSNLLDTLAAIEQVGREYDIVEYDKQFPDEPGDRDEGGSAEPERPLLFLDVAPDFIAVSLIRRIPDLEVPVLLQQEWLDELDPCARVRALNAFVVGALDDMMTPDRIYERAVQNRVKRYERVLAHRVDDPEDDPRGKLLRSDGDEFLQQRLRAAREQLTDPVARLRGKLDTCGMPRAVRAQLKSEFDRLSNDTDSKTMAYLRCLADLPWPGGKADILDLERARRVLDARHFGLREAKERIIEYLAVRRRKRDARGAVLCFVGPPGVGKSSLAASIAEALGRRFADVSCNGMRHASDVCGEQRAWAGAQPGRIIRQLQSVGARNPVFVLDEIDKIGEAAGVALLDALDPTRNKAFHDFYLEVPFDLSEVFFIATANVLGRIPTALRNRLEVIEIAGYSEADKLEIARRILVPSRILDHGLTSDLIEFEDRARAAPGAAPGQLSRAMSPNTSGTSRMKMRCGSVGISWPRRRHGRQRSPARFPRACGCPPRRPSDSTQRRPGIHRPGTTSGTRAPWRGRKARCPAGASSTSCRSVSSRAATATETPGRPRCAAAGRIPARPAPRRGAVLDARRRPSSGTPGCATRELPRSNSAQAAPRASPERQAVSTTNRRHAFADTDARDAAMTPSAAATSS